MKRKVGWGEEAEMSREAALDEFDMNNAIGTLVWVRVSPFTHVITEEARQIAARVEAVVA